MELVDYLKLLRRRWLLITAAVLVCVAGSVYSTSQQVRVYSSSVQFVLTNGSGQPVDTLLATAAQQRVPTYVQLATSPRVQAAVAAALPAGLRPGLLGVTGEGLPGTVFLSLSVQSDSAQGAFELATAYAAALPAEVARFDGAAANTGLAVFTAPFLPGAPVSPNPQRNYLVGLALGLVLGIAAALVAEALDRRLHTPEEAEKVSGLDLLAAVPIEHRDEPLVTVMQPRSRRAEAIRQVRTNVAFASVSSPLGALVVTSAVAGEGKTSISVNLALTSALASQRVILVDADLRRPMVAESFGIEGAVGLSDVLIGAVELDDALQPWGDLGDTLRILPSGSRPANPSELLASGAMEQLIGRLREQADLVLFDTPPVLPVTDAIALARSVDGVLLVTRVGSTGRDKLRAAVSNLRKVELRVVGLVANGGGDGEEYYYAEQQRPAAKSTARHKTRRRAAAPETSAPAPATLARPAPEQPGSTRAAETGTAARTVLPEGLERSSAAAELRDRLRADQGAPRND